MPAHCGHNAHMYYLRVDLAMQLERQVIMDKLKVKISQYSVSLHTFAQLSRGATFWSCCDCYGSNRCKCILTNFKIAIVGRLTGEQQEYIVSALLESIHELIH